jgi:hypothetical protein
MEVYLNFHFPIREYSLWIFTNIWVNSCQIWQNFCKVGIFLVLFSTARCATSFFRKTKGMGIVWVLSNWHVFYYFWIITKSGRMCDVQARLFRPGSFKPTFIGPERRKNWAWKADLNVIQAQYNFSCFSPQLKKNCSILPKTVVFCKKMKLLYIYFSFPLLYLFYCSLSL